MNTITKLWREFWKDLRKLNRRTRGNRAYRRGNRTGGRIVRVGSGGAHGRGT